MQARKGIAPTATPPPERIPTTPLVKFIGDISVPDKAVMPPGKAVTKVWEVENIGPTPWPVGVHVVPVGVWGMCDHSRIWAFFYLTYPLIGLFCESRATQWPSRTAPGKCARDPENASESL